MPAQKVILGGGESGAGAAILAHKKGYEVFVSDAGEIKEKYRELLQKYEIPWEEGQHNEAIILKAEEIIKSPGIPDRVTIVQKAMAKKIPVVSEIEFASRYTQAKKICVTGSNGKTTTTLWIYHMLKKAGLNVGVAGNVGDSFALQVAEKDYDHYVIELSSFQLDNMYDFKADIAILMNITPDHLDRYGYEMQNYIRSKFRILQNMNANDHFMYCADDEVILNEMAKHEIIPEQWPFSYDKEFVRGAFTKNEKLIVQNHYNVFTMSLFDIALAGKHNAYNSMAAAISGHVLNIRKEIIRESLTDFQGVEHRLEAVIKVHGIQFMNDSKATNINSTWYALESMKEPVIWIVGGVDKGNDYGMLTDLVKEKVRAIVCLGRDNTKIHQAFGTIIENIVDTQSMRDAVRAAYFYGKKGDIVLLSPACASFDLFENYEDRGRQFKKEVRNL